MSSSKPGAEEETAPPPTQDPAGGDPETVEPGQDPARPAGAPGEPAGGLPPTTAGPTPELAGPPAWAPRSDSAASCCQTSGGTSPPQKRQTVAPGSRSFPQYLHVATLYLLLAGSNRTPDSLPYRARPVNCRRDAVGLANSPISSVAFSYSKWYFGKAVRIVKGLFWASLGAVLFWAGCDRSLPGVRVICGAGESRCAGNAVETCSPDGFGWLDPVPCPPGEQCEDGKCIPSPCVPNCSQRECGPDGCGGECPPGCAEGQDCSESGECLDSLADFIEVHGTRDGTTITWLGMLSPVLYDLDGDGAQEMILTVAGEPSRLLIADGYGNILADRPYPEDAYAPGRQFVSIGDLYGEGPNILVPAAGSTSAFMLIFDAQADLLTSIEMPWLAPDPYGAYSLVDLDGDGNLDIVFAGWVPGEGVFLEAVDRNGWPLDGFPRFLVAGTHTRQYCSGSQTAVGILADPRHPSVVVAAWPNDDDSRPTTLYAFSSSGEELWDATFMERTEAGPVIGDLDGDGQGEVAIATRTGLRIFDTDGSPVAFVNPVPQDDWIHTVPALADVDGDGDAEIVFGIKDSYYIVDGDGRILHRIHSDWPNHPVIAADLDGDGLVDFASNQDTNLVAWNAHGTLVDGFPWSVQFILYSSPAVGDLDGDGRIEIVTSSLGEDWDAWDVGRIYIRTLNASSEQPAPWPSVHGGPRHTCFLPF